MRTATEPRNIDHEVAAQLGRELPDVDLREVQVVADTLRVVIDHPDGVDHDLCAATTKSLARAGLLERFAIEVSSPGPEPPLRTIEHYRQAVGRRVILRVEDAPSARARSVSGTLSAVEPDRVELTTADGAMWIPTGDIRRARVTRRSEP
jgi:ribosome maturation factor RimP